MQQPYTHKDHWIYCRDMVMQNRMATRRHVLVRKHTLVYCAQIIEPWTTPNGVDCWVVESVFPEEARFTVACKNTFVCSATDHTCMPVSAVSGGSAASDFEAIHDGGFCHARVVAPRDSLNYENLPVSGEA